MKNNSSIFLLLTITFSCLNISCAHHFFHKHKYKKDSLAVISPVNESKIQGWVHFQKTEDKQVLVKAKISGLKPNKKYGFHIHKYGDCRENGKNAGGHLGSYKGVPHGAPNSEENHMGDMGNLTSGKKGTAVYKEVLDICMRKIGGRSVIIHANEDDLKSQPSGNAGPYIGCGIIGYVQKSHQKVKKPAKEKKEELKKEQITKIKKETKIIEIKEKKTTKTKQTGKKLAEEKKEEPKKSTTKETKKPAEEKKEEPKKEQTTKDNITKKPAE